MPNFVTLSVVYAEHRVFYCSAKCRCAECRGAKTPGQKFDINSGLLHCSPSVVLIEKYSNNMNFFVLILGKFFFQNKIVLKQ
jgi:hypothetical protein